MDRIERLKELLKRTEEPCTPESSTEWENRLLYLLIVDGILPDLLAVVDAAMACQLAFDLAGDTETDLPGDFVALRSALARLDGAS